MLDLREERKVSIRLTRVNNKTNLKPGVQERLERAGIRHEDRRRNLRLRLDQGWAIRGEG